MTQRTVPYPKAAIILACSCAVGLAVRQAIADPIEWGSFGDIVPDQGVATTGFAASCVTIAGYNSGRPLPADVKWSLVVFVNSPEYGPVPVGGCDGIGSSVAQGFVYGAYNAEVGIPAGGNVDDYPEHPNTNGVYSVLFVDLNRNGTFGTYDYWLDMFWPDVGEWASIVSVMGSDSFVPEHTFSAGNVTAVYADPIYEPTSLRFTGVGSSVGAESANTLSLFVLASPLNCRFYLQCCTDLTHTNWFDVNPAGFIATGTVTTVVHTNSLPTAFYRASSASASP